MTVETQVKEASNEYQPHKRGQGTNPHVKAHGKKLLITSILFIAAWNALMVALAMSNPEDPLAQYRYLIGKLTTVITGDFALVWILWFVDYLCNGNLLGRILQNAIACAILGAALLYCNVVLFMRL